MEKFPIKMESESMPKETISLPEQVLALTAISNNITYTQYQNQEIRTSAFSNNSTKDQVSYKIEKKGGTNSAWWVLPCNGDGDPKWVCSMKGDRCTVWRC